ncbi:MULTISPECIES: aspartate/glutamate racemase family protein [Rhizobiaceae]|uniref:aspartate/glutamate racemase family protein n=1 Tax=Rhizobiaceae TaxID=82115 RepID=UPI0024127866|nr:MULTISPECIES: aspartate/glutamate racemase family protein [Rhizobiaceae]MDG3580295.1 aspartate/glutamate racemase family protein [Rhizobium sp. YJ-22]
MTVEQGPTARIALIHALEESVLPARAAFRQLWPEALCFDLLDTSLSKDLAFRGELDEAMIARFHCLADYASSSMGEGGSAAGLLFTCSAFAPAIDSVKQRLAIPVLRPNEAAFEAALDHGGRIGLVVSFEPSLASLSDELAAMAHQRGRTVSIKATVAEGALGALKQGDGETHDRLVAEAGSRLDNVDIIILGQFSLARAQTRLQQAVEVPVLTTPGSAVEALKERVRNTVGIQHSQRKSK